MNEPTPTGDANGAAPVDGAAAMSARPPLLWIFVVLAVLALVLAVLVVYLPTPGDYWIRYDNEGLIRNASRVQALALSGPERTKALINMFTTAHHDLYQPLLTFSLAMDYALFGWNRAGFHAHSLSLHVLIIAGLFFLIYRLTGSLPAALLATLLVAVHPVMVQAVSWIICRTFLLTAAWLLIATHFYLTYARNPRRYIFGILATVAYVVSMTAKLFPGLIVVPVIIDFWVRRKINLRTFLDKIPLVAAAGFFTWLNMQCTEAAADQASVVRPWSDVVADAPVGLVLTAANTLVPKDLALFYFGNSAWQVVGVRWIAVLFAAVVVIVAGPSLWKKGHRGLLLSAVGWLALVGPSVAAGRFRETVAADRYAYIPAFFFALGLAALLVPLFNAACRSTRPALWYATRLAVVLLAFPLAFQARAESRKWHDEARLWKTVIRLTPHPTAYGALGNVYSQNDQWIEAVEAYEKALALAANDPYARNNPIFHANLTQYARKAATEIRKQTDVADREAQATRFLTLARRVAAEGAQKWPKHPALHYDLGRACLEQNDHHAAITAFQAALELAPNHYRALTHLAIARYKLGQADAAVKSLQQSLAITTKYRLTISTLAIIYNEQKKYADAAAMFYNWIVLQPNNPKPHSLFFPAVFETARQKDYEKAEILLKHYLKKVPDSLQAKRMLGLMYAQQKKYAPARQLLQECLQANPNDSQLRQALKLLNRKQPP